MEARDECKTVQISLLAVVVKRQVAARTKSGEHSLQTQSKTPPSSRTDNIF